MRREERQVPLGRWARPEEIAPVVAYLASDEAAFVTGQVVSPNGGKTIVGFLGGRPFRPGRRGGMRELEGPVAVITGAGAGMGRAHALLLAERGARIVAQDIRGGPAAETAELVRQAGGEAEALACDVADAAAVKARLGEVGERLGRIDILVNNAGIGGEPTDRGDDGGALPPHVRGPREGRLLRRRRRWSR